MISLVSFNFVYQQKPSIIYFPIMKRCLVRSLCILLLTLSCPGILCANSEPIKREVRAVWMATVYCLDWPSTRGNSSSAITAQKKQLTDYLDRLESQNFNAIYFQVRSMCDAMYKSSYEPWSSYLTGTRGLDPGWDPLAFAVSECHKRGIECHAWVNPYRWSTSTSGWSTTQDQQLKDAGMLLTYTTSSATTTILNPGLESVRQRIVDVCREIAVQYDVDGIVFDDYFYPNGIPVTSQAADYSLWLSSGTTLSMGDWRRANVNQMVADVYNMIQDVRPGMKFGISPAGAACTSASVAAKHGIEPCPVANDWQYNGIFSDPVAWLKEGTVDYISPQIYWGTTHSTNPFGPMTKWWSYVAAHFGRHHYASHSISKLGTASNNVESEWADYVKQIGYSRTYSENAAPGAVLYSTAYVNGSKASGLGEYLHGQVFGYKALTPAINWKAVFPQEKVFHLRVDGTQLLWDGVEDVRYAVYAIPEDKDVVMGDNKGLSATYLVAVTYSPSWTIPSDYRSGYYFAVTVVDRYGNEYAIRTTRDNPLEPVSRPVLDNPKEGERISADFTLQWHSEETDGYILQVSSSRDFSDLQVNATSGWTSVNGHTAYSVLLEDMYPGTFYWRVIGHKSGCEDRSSAIGTFVIGAPVIEEGYVRKRENEPYAVYDGLKLENRWIRSVEAPWSNLSFQQDGSLNRGFCALGDTLYVVGRSGNSSTASCYLQRYDAVTGACYGVLPLNDSVKCPMYPCNDVLHDDAGHLLVANQVIKIGSQPILIYQVNPLDGSVVLRASCSSSKVTTGRVDYCQVKGDVVKGDFQVLAPLSSNSQVLKWTFSGGLCVNEEVFPLKEFPAGVSKTGACARLFSVDATHAVINGSTSWPIVYDMTTGMLASEFDKNSDACPESNGVAANGFCFFVMGENAYVVYPRSDYRGTDGWQFSLGKTKKDVNLSAMEWLWDLPQEGLGTINNGIYNAQADVVLSSGGDTAHVYVYVSGNGLAAYRLTGFPLVGISPVQDAGTSLQLALCGKKLELGVEADDVWLYDMQGRLLTHVRRVVSMSVSHLHRGVYVAKARKGKETASLKFSLP